MRVSFSCILGATRVGVLSAAAITYGGCSQILGLADITYVDAAPDGPPPDGPPFMSDCPTAPANTVIVCGTITHVRPDGTTFTTHNDLRRFTLAAYITDNSTSGFRIVSGAITADGTGRIENVTDGTPFYLRLQDAQDPQYPYPHYFYTDKHTIDVGSAEIGRDDTPALSDTEVTVNVTGMTPWRAGDTANLVSFSNGTQLSLASTLASVPAGSTVINQTFDWRTGFGETTYSDYIDVTRAAQLIDGGPGHGDELWAIHSTTHLAADNASHPVKVATIADAVNMTGVSMSNGTAVTIGGAFQVPPKASSQLTIAMSMPQIRNAFRDGGHYSQEDVSCQVFATPAATRGLVMPTTALLGVADNDMVATATGVGGTASYTDPFPTSWPQILVCIQSHTRRTKAPNGVRIALGLSFISSYTLLPVGTEIDYLPQIHTITNLMIGGVDGLAGGTVPFDGLTPVNFTWDPIPGVNHYEIRVKDENTTQFPAVFDTSQPSLTVPAETFIKGHFYAFRVFAIQTSGGYVDGKLLDFAPPLWSARLSSALLRFSDLCGNGVKDAGEECDPGSPGANTATCDADCTLPACGDGLVNPANPIDPANPVLHEQCDNVGDSPTCGTTCQVPVCGDGVWNKRAGEECDDSNTMSGDGCSADCKLERCGDGTTDAPFESCDDKNRINGDGCDAQCQIEPMPL